MTTITKTINNQNEFRKNIKIFERNFFIKIFSIIIIINLFSLLIVE